MAWAPKGIIVPREVLSESISNKYWNKALVVLFVDCFILLWDKMQRSSDKLSPIVMKVTNNLKSWLPNVKLFVTDEVIEHYTLTQCKNNIRWKNLTSQHCLLKKYFESLHLMLNWRLLTPCYFVGLVAHSTLLWRSPGLPKHISSFSTGTPQHFA